MNRENLVHNIRLLCTFYSISATTLSLKLNFSINRIGDIIAGRNIRLTNEEIAAIASFFKVTVDQLLYKKAILEFK